MQKRHVLLIEDSAPDAMLMRVALDEAGLTYRLTCLQDGQEAVEYVRKGGDQPDGETPDIILLDVNVPKVNGFEILREIRGAISWAKVPVFVLSSSQSPQDQAAILSVEGTTFETKPSDLDGFLELGRTIRKSLEGSNGLPFLHTDGFRSR